MNDESRENLSSLMDGEVNKEAGRFLVRRLGADEGFRKTWARYHLVRDCLRHQDGLFSQQDFSGRISEALSEEPEVQTNSRFAPGWLRPVAGLAAAASVAFLAVLAVSQGTDIGNSAGESVVPQTAVAEPFTSPNVISKSARSQPVNLSGRSAQDNQKMNAYLLRHYQATEKAGGKGFVSFVPIVLTQAPSSNQGENTQEEQDIESTIQ